MLLLVWFQSFSIQTSAQTQEATVELKIRNPESVYSAIDQYENYVFVFKSSSHIQFSFFTQTHQTNGNITIAIPSAHKKDDILGVQLKGEICTVYLHNTNKMTVSEIILNRTNGENSTRPLAQMDYPDKFLTSVLQNQEFYVLTVPQGKNQIDIWSSKDNVFERATYTIADMPDLYKRLSSGNSELNEETTSAVGIDKVYYDNENNVKSAQASKKLYTIGNSIFLTFDDPELTHLIEINLVTKTATYKQLQFTLDKGNTSSKKQGNSFLYYNSLFRATMSMDQLNIAIVQLDSLKLLANYNAYPGVPMTFKNGPIIQEGSTDKQKIIDDNNVYFKKVLGSHLSIAANKKDSLYVLEVGGYEEYTNNNGYRPMNSGPSMSIGMGMGMGIGMGGMGMGMGGMGGGYPMGGYGMGMPGYYGGYPGYYPYNSYTTTIRTVYFHSLLDSASLDHEPGIVPITLRERVSNFQSVMFKDKDPTLIRIVDRKNEILIGFLMPNKTTFRTYSFGK